MPLINSAIVYSLPDCFRCNQVKAALKNLGYDVEERSAEALERGEYHDNEALSELTFNDGAVPVVIVDGKAIREGDKLYDMIKEHKEW